MYIYAYMYLYVFDTESFRYHELSHFGITNFIMQVSHYQIDIYSHILNH